MMLAMLRLMGAGLLAGLAGCAGMAQRMEVTPGGMPYQGLTAGSYGPLTSAPMRICDPRQAARAAAGDAAAASQAQIQDFSQSVATSITSFIGKPLQGLTKVDSRLVSLELDKYIDVPSDSNHPSVAVLSHDPQGILFWHVANMVRLQELATAAGAYCTREGAKAAVHAGSASRCAPVETLGKLQVYPVYALSGFRCVR